MLPLSHHFEKLLSAIEPPPERLAAAAEIPGQVRDFLKATADLPTTSPHTRLVGSYARQTAQGDIKDVDLIVFVDDEAYADDPAGAVRDVHDALDGLPGYLGDGGHIELRTQRRSVRVFFVDRDFYLDIVPARLSGGLDAPLWVPDRPWQEWIKSDPLNYGTWLSTLNSNNGEKIVPLIKLFKHWRDTHFTYKRPKSFWLEALVAQHVRRGWVVPAGKSYGELVLALFSSVQARFADSLADEEVPTIPDPMLPQNHVAFNWQFSHFKAFMARLDESIGWAGRALDKPAAKRDEAVELWQKVFGNEFPSTVEDDAESLARSFNAGMFVAPSGLLTPHRPSSGPYVQPRPHTFHAEDE